MREIWFVLPDLLPFPPSKGGAVETLLQLFVEQNEIEKKYNITVFSIYDEGAEAWSKQFKYTTTKYIKNDYHRNWKSIFNEKIYNLTGKRIPCLNGYSNALRKEMESMNLPSQCIVEGGGYRNFKSLIKLIGINRLALHVHAICNTKFNASRYFGNFVFVSHAAQERWCVDNQYKSTVLMNAVDETKFLKSINEEYVDKLRNQYKISKKDFIVMYCGRLTEQKGVLELVKAINLLGNKAIKLLVVGSSNFKGADKTDYQKELEKYAGEFVIFTGFVENNQLNQYYNLSNVVVSPSLRDEAASLVNIETMVAGKALITTKQGGNEEYVNPRGAILLDDPEKKEELILKLRDAIKYLFENPEVIKNMEDSNIAFSKKFTKKEYYKNYSNIIDKLIE